MNNDIYVGRNYNVKSIFWSVLLLVSIFSCVRFLVVYHFYYFMKRSKMHYNFIIYLNDWKKKNYPLIFSPPFGILCILLCCYCSNSVFFSLFSSISSLVFCCLTNYCTICCVDILNTLYMICDQNDRNVCQVSISFFFFFVFNSVINIINTVKLVQCGFWLFYLNCTNKWPKDKM